MRERSDGECRIEEAVRLTSKGSGVKKVFRWRSGGDGGDGRRSVASRRRYKVYRFRRSRAVDRIRVVQPVRAKVAVEISSEGRLTKSMRWQIKVATRGKDIKCEARH
jgi:hypothetical protein